MVYIYGITASVEIGIFSITELILSKSDLLSASMALLSSFYFFSNFTKEGAFYFSFQMQ